MVEASELSTVSEYQRQAASPVVRYMPCLYASYVQTYAEPWEGGKSRLQVYPYLSGIRCLPRATVKSACSSEDFE